MGMMIVGGLAVLSVGYLAFLIRMDAQYQKNPVPRMEDYGRPCGYVAIHRTRTGRQTVETEWGGGI